MPKPNPTGAQTSHQEEKDADPCQIEAAPQLVGHAFLQVLTGLHQVEQDTQDDAGPCMSTGVRKPGIGCVQTPAHSRVAA